MSDITKIAIGEAVSFRVQTVTVDTAGKWPDYIFHAEDGRKFSAPKAAIDRQLEKRLNLSLGQLAGNPITIERAPNAEDAKKSWWNLSLAGESELRAGAPAKRMTQQEATAPVKGSFDAMMDDGDPGMPDPMTGERPLLDRIIDATGPVTDREAEYLALAGRVAAFQDALGKQYEMPWDGASVNAMTFSIWNKR